MDICASRRETVTLSQTQHSAAVSGECCGAWTGYMWVLLEAINTVTPNGDGALCHPLVKTLWEAMDTKLFVLFPQKCFRSL